MPEAELDPPTERTCERCGRRDRWDEAAGGWFIVEEDGEKRTGDRFCIHEWDVTATHHPFEE